MEIIKEIRLICADLESNKNRYWSGKLFDNGDCLCEWARVGDDPQSKLFPNAGEKFLLKKKAEKEKKGYRELQTIQGNSPVQVGDMAASNLESLALAQIKTSRPELKALIARLVKSNIHRITSNTNIQYNDNTGLFSTPLGIVTPNAIIQARDLLVKIKSHLDNAAQIPINITNEYLCIIPQNFGRKRITSNDLFPNDDAIKKQSDILDSLEASYTSLTSTPDGNLKHEEEKIFDTSLDILDDDQERTRISNWFYNSNHSTHGYSNVKIQEIYKTEIGENVRNFKNDLGNVMEVWHGSSSANCLSILKSGLKVTPPSTAAIAGKMFGAGTYGALDSSKSLQYTYGRFTGNKSDYAFLFVLDFAMGRIHYPRSYGGNVASGYDSVWAKKENTGLRFDELIVYKDYQSKIKYLLEIK